VSRYGITSGLIGNDQKMVVTVEALYIQYRSKIVTCGN